MFPPLLRLLAVEYHSFRVICSRCAVVFFDDLLKKKPNTTRGSIMRFRTGFLSAALLLLLGTSPASSQSAAEGKKLYVDYCSTSHGEAGKGDGPAAAALPVKPADHTNGAVMNQLSDDFLMTIISKGGTAAGKSSFMPSWGGALDQKQIREIVAYLRTIADPPYKPGKPPAK